MMPSLLHLPNELLAEILKHYPPQYAHDVDALVQGARSRQFSGDNATVLRALSQTCRRLRIMSLPALWACIYAGSPCIPGSSYESGGKLLERRMRGIRKTTYVVPYIQYLCVNLDECSMEYCTPPISQFIRVLRLLSNLRALTIFGVPEPMRSILSTSCWDFSFPSIVTLAIPDDLAPILHCFPNLQTLTNVRDKLMHFGDGRALIRAAACCAHLHTINNLIPFFNIGECLRSTVPNVRSLLVCMERDSMALTIIFKHSIRSIEGMKNLSELRVQLPWNTAVPGVEDRLRKVVIDTGKETLRTSKALGPKELRFEKINEHRNTVEHVVRFTLVGNEWSTDRLSD
ncbi:hypothetical protein C8R47DRAFT_1120096 [Mycena vitilis]|nr:hypothetical protein C8R47DRAFT_1120096 [Mycena vitilis]